MPRNWAPLATQIDTHLQTLMADDQFQGVVLQAVGDNILLNHGYGFADRELGVAHTPDTLFPIASLTKPFTALAVLILVARQQVKLAAPVRLYLPECPHHWNAITVHHLLSHTSGIPNLTAVPQLDLAEILPASHWMLVRLIADYPLDFAPGVRWAYSNTGYLLLGMLIEHVTAQSYAEFLEAQIFRPLQMNHTTCTLPGTTHYAYGYGYSNGTITRCVALDFSHCPAAGGIYSTANDLYRWCRHSEATALVPSDLFQTMQQPQTLENTELREWYGYGWAIREAFGTRLIYHDGRLSGYKHCLGRLCNRQTTTIVLSNYNWVKPCLTAQAINTMTFESAEQHE